MRRCCWLLYAMVLVLAAGSVLGQTRDLNSPSAADCSQATTTAAMRTCQNTRYEAAQHNLETVYQSLLKQLDSAGKEKLRRAQRAWLRFRDANADFQASAAQGGTLAPLVRITVLTDMTNARTAELQKQTSP